MHIWSFTLTFKGSLGEMVTLCNGCIVYEPWAARALSELISILFLQTVQHLPGSITILPRHLDAMNSLVILNSNVILPGLLLLN